MDGYLALGPYSNQLQASIVKGLYNAKMIAEEKVAFLLTWNTNMNNFVFLGDVDETAYRGTLTI